MIDAERMLGSLVRNAMGGGGRRRGRRRRRRSMLGGAAKGALGLGALGVAIAAFEHFSKQGGAASTFTAGGSPGGAPPPPSTRSSAVPPPPPAPPSAPPPPPGAPAPATAGGGEDATLLVRAMIAAANADHEVDEEERTRILRGMEEAGLGEEEKRFLLAELEAPLGLAALAAAATTPELARQVYLASRMAIEVDTAAESNYLSRLAARLGLDAGQVRELDALVDGGGEPAT